MSNLARGSFLLVLLLASSCTDVGAAGDEQRLSWKQLLGKRLFEDENLSRTRGQSCASCHDPARAFTGTAGSPNAAVAQGIERGVLGGRNVPTAMYASFSPPFGFVEEQTDAGVEYTPTGGQFWDGRAATLADQAKGPFLNPREMNNADAEAVVEKVRESSYASLFRAVYGQNALDDTDAAYDFIADAIAAFEDTPAFHPFSSKFDDVLRGTAQLDPLEARGFELFKDPQKGNCLACHAGTPGSRDPREWLFTDFTYDNLGLPRNRSLPDTADAAFFDLGLCAHEGLADQAPEGVDIEDFCGAFKVPTLRNVARTAPYGHNGVFTELRDVVKFYATRDTSAGLWFPGAKFDDLPPAYVRNVNTSEPPYDRKPGEQPRLSDDDVDAIVAFLETLTDR